MVMDIRSVKRNVNVISVASFTTLLLIAAIPQAKVAADTGTIDAKALYGKYCALCHGSSGQGGMALKLQNLKDDDTKITSVITSGGTKGMPAFGKKLTPDQITALVAYLHTLGKK